MNVHIKTSFQTYAIKVSVTHLKTKSQRTSSLH